MIKLHGGLFWFSGYPSPLPELIALAVAEDEVGVLLHHRTGRTIHQSQRLLVIRLVEFVRFRESFFFIV